MLNEQVQHADVHRPELGHALEQILGDEVKAAAHGRQPQGALDPHHPATLRLSATHEPIIRATRISTRAPRNGTPSRVQQPPLAVALGQ